jgi:thiol-disulfide isomerase/thioredoxin
MIVAAVLGFAVAATIGSAVFSGKKSPAKSSPAVSVTAAAGAASGTTVAGAVGTPTKAGETQDVTVSGTALVKFGDGADPAIGQKAPTLNGFSFDGSPVSLQPGGSPMLVLFVAHWCPHCQREVPLIVKYLADGKLPAGMKVMAVATGTSSDAPNYPPSAWLQKVGFTPPVLADSKDQLAAAAYGLPGYPYFVVLKADGTVAYRGSGEKTVDELDKLLASAAS